MKNYRRQIMLCFCAMLLIGCTETPSEVREEISELDAVSAAEHENDFTDTLTDIALLEQDIQQTLQDKNGTIVLKSCLVPHKTELHTYTLSLCDSTDLQTDFNSLWNLTMQRDQSEYAENISVFEDTLPLTKIDETDVSALHLQNNVRTLGCYPKSETDADSLVMGVTQHGAYNFMRCADFVISPYLIDTIKTETVYDAEHLDSVVYRMHNQTEWSVSDAASYAAAAFHNISHDDFCTYQAMYVQAKRIADDAGYGYWMMMNRVAPDGVQLYPFMNLKDSPVNSLTEMILPDYSWIWCTEKDRIQELHKAECFQVQSTAGIAQVIPLSAAKKIAESALAGARTYRVECRLCYCIKLYGTQVAALTGNDFSEALAYHDYRSIVCEPYWVFTDANSGDEIRYLVNAQTGAFEIR